MEHRSEQTNRITPEDSLARCIHGNPAPCQNACPFGLDIRVFIARMQGGKFDAALRQYRDATVFPLIVSALCKAPCKAACVRSKVDAPVALPLLEQACLAHSGSRRRASFNLPPKRKHIAIIGADLSGLACAVRFAAQKYDVTVYERAAALESRLLRALAADALVSEVMERLMAENISVCCRSAPTDAELSNADVVLVSSGEPFAGRGDRVFFCPDADGPVERIAAGIGLCSRIEWFLKTGAHMDDQGGKRRVQPAVAFGEPTPASPIAPADGNAYSADEAVQEACRCIRCDCTACVDHCEMLSMYQLYPNKLKEDVETTLLPDQPLKQKPAMRPVNSCNLCGRCTNVCPAGVDLSAYLLQSRRALFEQGLLPPAFHAFWLNDLADAERYAFTHRSSLGPVKYAFFPGCQLGASHVDYVGKTYALLKDICADTALLLRCCGMPALWAGDSAAHAQSREAIRTEWEALGRPVLIIACPSCFNSLSGAVEGMACISLYEYLARTRTEGFAARMQTMQAAVFDPCAARQLTQMRRAVRALLTGCGVCVEPLPLAEDDAACCSYGGQIYAANRPLAETIVAERTKLSELAYITYCSNCRDIFASSGKACAHVLDILFGLDGFHRPPAGLQQRRENRRMLYCQFHADNGGEAAIVPHSGIRLVIAPELSARMDTELILHEDVASVIACCEESGSRLFDPQSGNTIAHRVCGQVTCWVIYRKRAADEYEVFDAYSHRMRLEET